MWEGSFVKVNVTKIGGCPALVSISMMVVKNGKVIDRWAGALPEGPLRSRLAPHLK
jgi:hypothetical protein